MSGVKATRGVFCQTSGWITTAIVLVLPLEPWRVQSPYSCCIYVGCWEHVVRFFKFEGKNTMLQLFKNLDLGPRAARQNEKRHWINEYGRMSNCGILLGSANCSSKMRSASLIKCLHHYSRGHVQNGGPILF